MTCIQNRTDNLNFPGGGGTSLFQRSVKVFNTVKAGSQVRCKDISIVQEKGCVNWDDASTSTTRSTTTMHACASIVPVYTHTSSCANMLMLYAYACTYACMTYVGTSLEEALSVLRFARLVTVAIFESYENGGLQIFFYFVHFLVKKNWHNNLEKCIEYGK